MKRQALVLFLIVSMQCFIGGCAVAPLSAEPIDSQIVDVDTGSPIEGAVIVAYWALRAGSQGFASSTCGKTKVEDAVTDKDGRFHLSGWGPTPPGCGGALHGGDPMLYVFKPGYHVGNFTNGLTSINVVVMTRNDWENRQMKLKAFPDANVNLLNNDYFNDFDRLVISLDYFVVNMPTECNWKRMPDMIRAIALQEKAFNDAGRNYHGMISKLISNDQWYQKEAPQCGSPKSFIEGLLK